MEHTLYVTFRGKLNGLPRYLRALTEIRAPRGSKHSDQSGDCMNRERSRKEKKNKGLIHAWSQDLMTRVFLLSGKDHLHSKGRRKTVSFDLR